MSDMLQGLTQFAVFAAICMAAALSGAVFPPGLWYERLRKPQWTPPNWLLPIAWSVLYIMIAGAGWLIWRAGGAQAGTALTAWSIQLVLNAIWSGLFFGLRRPDLALVELVMLWAAIVATVIAFAAWSTAAAALMLPYLVWVSFAAVLNFAIWRMNQGRSRGVSAPAS